MSRTVEPGDNIKLGTSGVSGVVRDVTWRYTTVDNPSGTHIVIPNSMMNTTALIHLARPECVSVPLVVTDSEQRLTTVAHRMEEAAAKALKRVDKVKKGPSVTFSEVTAQGFQGSLSFTLADASKVSAATDAAIRAIAPYCHPHALERTADAIAEEVGALTAAEGAEPPASAKDQTASAPAPDADAADCAARRFG